MLRTVIIIVRACNGVRFERVCIRFQRVIQTKKAFANSVDLVILPLLTLAGSSGWTIPSHTEVRVTAQPLRLHFARLVVILFYLLGRF